MDGDKSLLVGADTLPVPDQLQAMLTDPRFLAMMSGEEKRTRTEPGIFVSGFALDDDEGVEENDDDMDTDDPAKMMLKSAEHGDVATMRTLLEANPDLVNVRDSDAYTPLHRAAYNNHGDAIALLLSHKADPRALTENGWTGLHCAACWGCAASTEVLLGAGVEVNARTNGGLTPLHLVAACTESSEGAVAVVRLLLGVPGIDVSAVSGGGEMAAQIAHRNCARIYSAITGEVVEELEIPEPDGLSQGSFESLDSSTNADIQPPAEAQ